MPRKSQLSDVKTINEGKRLKTYVLILSQQPVLATFITQTMLEQQWTKLEMAMVGQSLCPFVLVRTPYHMPQRPHSAGPVGDCSFDIKLAAEAGRSGYLLNSARGTLGASCEVENCWCPGEMSWLWGQPGWCCSCTAAAAGQGLASLCLWPGWRLTLRQRLQQGGQGGGSSFLPFQALQGAPGMLSQPLATDLTSGTWDCQQQRLTAAFPAFPL